MTQNNDESVERANEIFTKFKQEHRHVTGGLQCYSELNEVEKQAAFKGIEFSVKNLMSQNEQQEAFDKWLKANYPEYPPPLSKVWQAATQASESEINSLKQRVDELQADNERLRELCAKIYADLQMGKACRETMENLRAALSSTPAQSLAEHDNEVVAPYKKALEFAEYMAKSTEQFMIAINQLDEADQEEDEETIEIMQEKRGEHWRAVNSSIYEFRQRSDRALKATP